MERIGDDEPGNIDVHWYTHTAHTLAQEVTARHQNDRVSRASVSSTIYWMNQCTCLVNTHTVRRPSSPRNATEEPVGESGTLWRPPTRKECEPSHTCTTPAQRDGPLKTEWTCADVLTFCPLRGHDLSRAKRALLIEHQGPIGRARLGGGSSRPCLDRQPRSPLPPSAKKNHTQPPRGSPRGSPQAASDRSWQVAV